MGLKVYNSMILFFLGIIILASSCNRVEQDSNKLCTEFYQLNKDKGFEGLFDVTIGTARVESIYDRKSSKYDLIFKTIGVYDVETKGYVTIPVFDKSSSVSAIDSTLKNYNQQTKDFLSKKLRVADQKKLLPSYLEYVNMILEKYYNIETPDSYSSKSVIVEGNPTLGKFITFTLDKECKCYFLKDPSSLNQYWSDYFKKLNRIDSSWFYEIKN